MKAFQNPYRRQPAPEPVKQNLPVVVHPDHNPVEFDQLLEEHHYLGSNCQAGDYLRQRVFLNGNLVGLMAWGACCYSLKDRDDYIGWNPTQRAERQKLVVQQRRFLLLTDAGEHPNLASQVLGAAVRVLPEQWMKQFGYQPLAAETFTDIEAFKGTCYKAAGWMPLGVTKGFSRHRADYFTPNGKPKKLWFKVLRPGAEDLLRGAELPEECVQGAQSSAHGVLPVTPGQLDSLLDYLKKFPDPRAGNRTFRLSSILGVVVMAQLCGKTTISDIVRFGQHLTQAQRKEMGFPCKKGTTFRKVPQYIAYRHLLGKIDPEKLGAHLSVWLQSQNGKLPGVYAMDGKMFRNLCGVVSIVDTQTGLPVSMAPMRHKDEGTHGELTCGRKAVEQMGDLDGIVITGDALHADRKSSQAILQQGGEYLFQLKDNQPTLLKTAQRATREAPLFARN